MGGEGGECCKAPPSGSVAETQPLCKFRTFEAPKHSIIAQHVDINYLFLQVTWQILDLLRFPKGSHPRYFVL